MISLLSDILGIVRSSVRTMLSRIISHKELDLNYLLLSQSRLHSASPVSKLHICCIEMVLSKSFTKRWETNTNLSEHILQRRLFWIILANTLIFISVLYPFDNGVG
jgi:hypothetical protein